MKRKPFVAPLGVALVVAAVAVLYWRDGQSPAHFLVKEADAYDAQNPLIQKMKRGDATLGEVVEGLGSVDKIKRRQAARAIFALRQHYIADVQAVVENGYKSSLPESNWDDDHSQAGRMQWAALRVLSTLRPSDKRVTKSAVEHIGFNWTPLHAGLNDAVNGNAATFVLVSSSTAALPLLPPIIAVAPLPKDKEYAKGKAMALLCALSVMDSATPTWLKHEAALAPNPKQRTGLSKAAVFLAPRLKPEPGFGRPDLVTYFTGWHYLESGGDDGYVESTDINSYKIPWDIAKELTSQEGLKKDPATAGMTKQATQLRLTMDLLKYAIAQRLNVDPDKESKRYKMLFPEEARMDAIRVLGCLRPLSGFAGQWVLWQRLRQLSFKGWIEDRPSEETAAIYRALGQIDIPAARTLVDRISSEWNEGQQRAAAFALGKVMGRYSIYFIKEEITQRQGWIKDTTDKNELATDTAELKRLQAMLKLGTEKKWFVGEYYGYNDPHAYDLIFPDEATKPEAVKTN